MRPFFGQLQQVVARDGCFASSCRSNEEQWNFVRQVDLEKVRLTCSVYRWNDEVAELHIHTCSSSTMQNSIVKCRLHNAQERWKTPPLNVQAGQTVRTN